MNENSVLTVKDVMRIMHLGQGTVLKWINGKLEGTPKLPATRVGRRWIVRYEDLMAIFSGPGAPASLPPPASAGRSNPCIH